jgi:hypothetical protein
MKSALMLIVLISLLFVSPGTAMAGTGLTPDLTVEVESNIFDLQDYLPLSLKNIGARIEQTDEFPDTILLRQKLDFQMPLWAKEDSSRGLFIQGTAWAKAPQEIAELYHDFVNDPSLGNGRFYPLSFQGSSYTLLGLYDKRTMYLAGTEVTFTQRLFTVRQFETLDLNGQGIIRVTDEKKIGELHGSYRWRRYEGAGSSWGGSLSCRIGILNNPNLKMAIELQNMLAYAYLPRLETENGSFDSIHESVSPITLNGFRTVDSEVVELPLTANLQLSYPVGSGSIHLDALKEGEVQEFSLGYQLPLHEGTTFIAAVNPIMHNLSLKYCRNTIEAGLRLGGEKFGKIRGVSFRLRH